MASSLLGSPLSIVYLFFFFSVAPPTEMYTLSLHDALPICEDGLLVAEQAHHRGAGDLSVGDRRSRDGPELRHVEGLQRSEEHTYELQSLRHLVCRLLLEKKKIPRATARGPRTLYSIR